METSTLNLSNEENSIGALETEENTSQNNERGLLIHQGMSIYKPEEMEGPSLPLDPWRGINSRKLSGGTDGPDHFKGPVEFSKIEVYGESNQQGETDLEDKFCIGYKDEKTITEMNEHGVIVRSPPFTTEKNDAITTEDANKSSVTTEDAHIEQQSMTGAGRKETGEKWAAGERGP